MTNEEIARFFNTTRPFIQGNPNLRDPQVEGWFRTRQHFRNSSEHAILQIPVGCGKTGLMALLPFETAQGRRHCSRNQEHVICQGDKCLASRLSTLNCGVHSPGRRFPLHTLKGTGPFP